MYLNKVNDKCFFKLLISQMLINNIKKFSVFLCYTYFKYLPILLSYTQFINRITYFENFFF